MLEKADILYIHSTKKLDDLQYSIMPVGAIALLNILKDHGFTIKAVNMGIEKSLDRNYEPAEELKQTDYKILFMDLHWYEHSYGVMQLAKLSKQIHQNVPVILGGFTSTIYGREIIRDFSCVDYILKGDSEEPIKLLADYLIREGRSPSSIPNIVYRENEKIVDKEITYQCNHVDDLNYVDYEFIKNADLHGYTTINGVRKIINQYWLFIARGCSYNCSYCGGSGLNTEALFGRKCMMVRSPGKIAEDIEKLHNKGIQLICPTHDFQMFGKKFYKKLFLLLRERNVKAGLYLECFQLPEIDFLAELIDTFDRNRLRIAITLLSGDEEVRRANGKNFNNEDFFKSLNYAYENGIKTELFYSTNLPGEKAETFEKTISQMDKIAENYYFKDVIVRCEKVVLDPLAPMRNKEYDLKIEMNTFLDYYEYCKLDGDSSFTGYSDQGSNDLVLKEKKLNDFKKRATQYYRKQIAPSREN
nr:radical SAM protein [uncultured Clostridium sp.]